jgi:probable F420-dependent oxidoreductase
MRFLLTDNLSYSDDVRFGISLQSGPDPVAFARLAEAKGFDYLSCGEHLAFHGPTTNAFISLAVAAGATRRIGLVSAVTLLPLYPAAVAAKLVMSLDVASGGRLTLGVGVGGEYPREFEAAGVPVTQRGARTDESLEIMRRLMTEERVTVDGRFSSFRDLTLAPRPARPVPVWVAGRKEAALRRVVRHGDGWMPYLVTPEQVADGRATLQHLARQRGADGWTGTTVLFAFTTVDADAERARAIAVEHVGRTYRQDFERFAGRYLLHGTPEQCAARVREYRDAGVDTVLFRLACSRRDAAAMLELIADEVVPRLTAPG